MKTKTEMYRNFTAILPVTCNANCVFCPEKEMENKATKANWLDNLVTSIFKNRKRVDHVSISGGEPTLNVKLLQQTIDTILSETHITRIGLTSNGQFLESANKTLNVLNALTDKTSLECKLDFMNISMHSFNADLNMEIMGISSMFDLDALVRFRKLLGHVSFHINFVICKQNIKNILWEMKQAKRFMEDNPNIDVVFRVDYNMKAEFKKLHAWAQANKRQRHIMEMPALITKFNSVFGTGMEVDPTMQLIGYCPSCFTMLSKVTELNSAYLKASAYEPNAILDVPTELVYHMDGNLYFDWSRNQPVNRTSPEDIFDEDADLDESAFEPDEELPMKTGTTHAKKKQTKTKAKRRTTSSSGSGGRCGYGGGGGSCRY